MSAAAQKRPSAINYYCAPLFLLAALIKKVFTAARAVYCLVLIEILRWLLLVN